MYRIRIAGSLALVVQAYTVIEYAASNYVLFQFNIIINIQIVDTVLWWSLLQSNIPEMKKKMDEWIKYKLSVHNLSLFWNVSCWEPRFEYRWRAQAAESKQHNKSQFS